MAKSKRRKAQQADKMLRRQGRWEEAEEARKLEAEQQRDALRKIREREREGRPMSADDKREKLEVELKLLAREQAPGIARSLADLVTSPSRVISVAAFAEELAELEAARASTSDPEAKRIMTDLIADAELRIRTTIDRSRIVKEWDDIGKRDAFMEALRDGAKAIIPVAAKLALTLA